LVVMRKIVVPLSLLFVCACSGKAASAPTPDAMAPIDAAVEVQPDAARECAFTLCGDDCVDLTANFEHCGACDNLCPGVKACRASVCECPAFVFPSNLSFLMEGKVVDQCPEPLVGFFGAFGNAYGIHVLLVGFDPVNVELGVPIQTGNNPVLGVGYRIDTPENPEFQSFYFSAGSTRITFERACSTGVKGYARDIQLLNVDTMGNVLSECTVIVDRLDFTMGDDCSSASGPDAGP
jgi:hypothetical protein